MSSEQIAREIPVLTEQVGRLVGAVTNDSTSRARFERAIGRNNRFLLAIVAVVAAVGLVTAYGVYNIIDARGSGRALQRAIVDCVSPDGQCYQQAQAREAEQTAEIARQVGDKQKLLIACSIHAPVDFDACADLALQSPAAR